MNRRDFIRFSVFALGLAALFSNKGLNPFLESEKNQKKLKLVEVHLSETCNLNCKGCSHFSCIAEKDFLEVDEFEKDIKQLSKIINKSLYCLTLLGGEPLLNPRVKDFFPIAKRYLPDTDIQILTNGILLNSQSNEFWEACRDNKVLIWISPYPVDIKLNEIMKKSKEYNVPVRYQKQVKHWVKFVYDFKGRNTAYCGGECAQLRHGKLFPCAKPAYIDHFNKYFNKNIPVEKGDYIDIYKNDKSFDEIYAFVSKPTPFCKYCDLRKFHDVPWGVTKHEISEWT